MAYLREPLIILAFGSRLRQVRKERKMSQEELAHLAGIAVSQVGRIERGVLNPSISTLFAIARALEVEPKELFDFKEKLIRKSPDQKKKK
ncbi:MAG TPA: helix-turn-helix transcriptional regulator [Bacteroidia bacterium]